MLGIHPVAFWITVFIVGVLAITPLIFLVLEKAGKLSPALRTDLWTRYKSWLVLAPLMVAPLLIHRLTAIIGVGVLSRLPRIPQPRPRTARGYVRLRPWNNSSISRLSNDSMRWRSLNDRSSTCASNR